MGGFARSRLTGEDLPAGGEQRGAHREAAVGAISGMFGLLAAAKQKLQFLPMGTAPGGSGGRVLPVTLLHACNLPALPADAAVKHFLAWKIDRPALPG